MADVAKAAGVSPGAIYLYFTSRDELLFATAIAEIDELERRMRASIHASLPADEVLRGMVDAYYEFARDRPEGFRMLVAGLERGPRLRAPSEAVAQYERRALDCIQLLHGVVQRGMADGILRKGDAWELTHAIWGTFHGILALAVSRRSAEHFLGFEVHALIRRAADTLLDGVREKSG